MQEFMNENLVTYCSYRNYFEEKGKKNFLHKETSVTLHGIYCTYSKLYKICSKSCRISNEILNKGGSF